MAASLAVALAMQIEVDPVRPLRPEFTARQIGPTNGWLWPGRMFSIYGKQLGPEQSCVRDAGKFQPDGSNPPEQLAAVERTLPTALCGVQVLMDEQAVPLIYVHEKQINFVVPGLRSFGDKVTLRVVRFGVSSIPVEAKFGPERMSLDQEEQAYAGMPVWVRLYKLTESKTPVELPFGIPDFWFSECRHVEVKFNGSLLLELKPENPTRVALTSSPCTPPRLPSRPALAGRIPLHLRYRMDRPGAYLVRYVPGSRPFYLDETTAETEWTPIVLKPGTAEQRRQWLMEMHRSAPTDREALLYDFLPSLFGYGDSGALEIGLEYLYNADAQVVRAAAGYLRHYYPASELIPALGKVKEQRGANRAVEQLLVDIGVTRPGR